MAELADQLHLDYQSHDRYDLLDTMPRSFKLFKKGRRKRIKNLMSSDNAWHDAEVFIFDYHYVVGGGNSTRLVRQTAFLLRSQRLHLPELMMQPENIFHKIGDVLGMQDIDFDEFPKFSSNYLLKGPNENWIRQTMHESLLHFFTVEKNWSLEMVGDEVLFYRAGRRLSPGNIHDFFEKGLTICDLLLETYGGEFVDSPGEE